MLRQLPMLLLAVTALALAACGDDDKEDIQQTVRDFVSASSEPDPEAFCGELVEIRSTKIDGDEATVRAVIKAQGRSATQTLRLEQEDGRWKLSGGGP